VATEVNSATWKLADLDLLERAGLATLYMTLRAAQEEGHNLAPLRCEPNDLQSRSVTVRWEGTAKQAFAQLFEWAWQVPGGVLYFPAVHHGAKYRENLHLRLPIHTGILGTFLQHRAQVQKAGKAVYKSVTVDEGQEIRLRYEPLDQQQLAPRRIIETILKTDSDLEAEVRLSSWLKPGCTTRYPSERTEPKRGWQEGPWKGTIKNAILLMMAPIACWYLRLPSQQAKKKSPQAGGPTVTKKQAPKWFSNWVMIVPDIRDLTEADQQFRRARLDLSFVDVASLGDAALRFVAKFATDDTRRQYHVGCRAVAMGRVTYYPNQNVRKRIMEFSPDPSKRRRYLALHNKMDNIWIPPDESVEWEGNIGDSVSDNDTTDNRPVGRIRVPSARGRIADNLVEDRPWYAELLVPQHWQLDLLESQRKKMKENQDEEGKTISLERLWFKNLQRQASRIRALVSENAMWDSPEERIFLRVMYDMLRTLMWKEIDALSRGGSRDLFKRIDDLIERIRRELENAKTRALLRDTLCKWLAKGGAHDAIRQNRAAVWGLVNHSHDWQKARDLARLALVTYESNTVSLSMEPEWSVLPEELQAKVVFDPERNALRFIGAMTEDERDALRNLFDAPKDQAAIDDLHRKSQEI
jgi:CRISPR-associated protein Cas8a1/Csx13